MYLQRLKAATLSKPVRAAVLAFAAMGACAVAQALPQIASVPGGIALVRFMAADDATPSASFRGKPVFVMRDEKGWFALVGLPLELEPGTHELAVRAAAQGEARDSAEKFDVAAKAYPSQHLTIADPRKVEPTAEDMRRIRIEQHRIDAAKNHWTELRRANLDLQAPAQGRRSSRFGLRRFFNGQARNPHAGLDIAIPSGTQVVSAASGTVVDTGDYFFNGKTVFVDHGQGLITMYCHLSQVAVRTGDRVALGQALGLSGMTGRASGPHLHWGVIMNGALVNPELFIGVSDDAR
jgi:Peptidase family M23/Peptidase family M23 N-terminal domain